MTPSQTVTLFPKSRVLDPQIRTFAARVAADANGFNLSTPIKQDLQKVIKAIKTAYYGSYNPNDAFPAAWCWRFKSCVNLNNSSATKVFNLGSNGATSDGQMNNGNVGNMIASDTANGRSGFFAAASSQSISATSFTATPDNQYTFCGWYKGTGSVTGSLLYKANLNDRFVVQTDGTVRFNSNAGQVNTSAGAAVLNTWQFWTVVVNGTTITIYLNGAQVATGSITTRGTDNVNPWSLSGTAFLNGFYDLPMMFRNVNLSGTQITALFNQTRGFFGV